MQKIILDTIIKSIKEINQSLDKEIVVSNNSDAHLYGGKGQLDSLGLVNLLVAVEQNIEDEFDTSIVLADERAMSQKHSPFKTVGSLADYIEIILKEKLND